MTADGETELGGLLLREVKLLYYCSCAGWVLVGQHPLPTVYSFKLPTRGEDIAQVQKDLKAFPVLIQYGNL